MIKLENINEFWSQIIAEQYRGSSNNIQKYIQKNEKYVKAEVLKVFDSLFMKGRAMQEKGCKQGISYIHIFYLQSALYTGRYEVQLTMFDHSFYLDKAECYELWTPAFIMNYFEEDIKHLERKTYNEVVHVGYPEMKKMRKLYYPMYYLLITECVKKLLADICTLPSYVQLEKNQDVGIYLGGYMDRALKIYPVKGESY